jgi:hypothetical protein
MTRIPILLLILAVGCPWDDDPDKPDTEDTSGATDTEPASDTATETDNPVGDSWDLVELWRYEGTDWVSAWNIAAGPLVDGNGDGVIDGSDPKMIVARAEQHGFLVLDHEGKLVSELGAASNGSLTLADLDPSDPGMEVLFNITSGDNSDQLTLFTDQASPVWTHSAPPIGGGSPWITDLEGDGSLEILVGAQIRDAQDGTLLRSLEVTDPQSVGGAIAADLDMDGVQEIILAESESPLVGIWNVDGTLKASCGPPPEGPWTTTAFAVGDLDGDPQAELVAARRSWIAICDADGKLLSSATTDAEQPAMLGLGELDGDGTPEILLADFYGLSAYDGDLTLLWKRANSPVQEYYPFSLADLDGDGRHEVLVFDYTGLVILDGLGNELVTWNPGVNAPSWIGQPLVVDLDADGLAEIVLGGYPFLSVLENTSGGWEVEGDEYAWPAMNHHPGDRGIDGGLGTATSWWTDPSHNVWQGLPL